MVFKLPLASNGDEVDHRVSGKDLNTNKFLGFLRTVGWNRLEILDTWAETRQVGIWSIYESSTQSTGLLNFISER